MRYCPCCRDEFAENEEFCLDCKIPLLEGKIPERFNHFCDCMDAPIGELVTKGYSVAIRDISNMTNLTGDSLKEYIQKIISFNK